MSKFGLKFKLKEVVKLNINKIKTETHIKIKKLHLYRNYDFFELVPLILTNKYLYIRTFFVGYLNFQKSMSKIIIN